MKIHSMRLSPRSLRVLRWLLGAAILLFAGSVLWRQLQNLSLEQVRAAWSDTSTLAIASSVLGTVLSFACLAGYERFATWQIAPDRIPASVALRVGAMSHAISNTLGFHVLTGSALRYRAYRGLGLTVTDVARVVAVVGACVVLGVFAVSAMALVWVQVAAGGWPLVLLLSALALLLSLLLRKRAMQREPRAVPIVLRHAGWLLVLGVIEMTAAIGALYALMPAATTPMLAPFVLLFVTATLLGIVSHAPGGIGVFEASILTAMPGDSRSQALVALLAYRVIYNLLPFALTVMVLLLRLLRRRIQDPI